MTEMMCSILFSKTKHAIVKGIFCPEHYVMMGFISSMKNKIKIKLQRKIYTQHFYPEQQKKYYISIINGENIGTECIQ